MRISWDDPGSRLFEAGVDRGVFFPKAGMGVPWNGLLSVKEAVDNEGSAVTYVDGQKIVNQLQLGDFAADISAVTYPDEMYPYDGYQQPMFSGQARPLFNLSYRSLIGSDREGLSYGYRLHLIFNCMLTPSNRVNQTMNDQMDISDFEWKLSTIPVATPYNRPSSHFMLESPNLESEALIAVENMLYGVDGGINPTFPTVQQLLDIFEANAIVIVVDNGDGTGTITGPDSNVHMIDADTAELSWPNVIFLGDDSYQLKSF